MAKKKIVLLIVALLAVDQIVKIWIKTHFALDESVIPSFRTGSSSVHRESGSRIRVLSSEAAMAN